MSLSAVVFVVLLILAIVGVIGWAWLWIPVGAFVLGALIQIIILTAAHRATRTWM